MLAIWLNDAGWNANQPNGRQMEGKWRANGTQIKYNIFTFFLFLCLLQCDYFIQSDCNY